ncbi:MAG: family peptidase [Actinotalea sp.]|nr:family peptidase [Actinotalea sp.]
MTPRQRAAQGAPFDEAGLAAARASVEVRRSARRTRTVTAFREGGRTIVAIPARFSRKQEREWVDIMVMKMVAQDQRRRPSDAQLLTRAGELSRTYLDGRARPQSVAWSSRQGRRWGSCTPTEGSIRISTRIRGMPTWVVDYVLLHELAHLLRAGHGPEFWALLDAYPLTEKAKGYLEGYSFARDGGAHDGADDQDDEEQAGTPTDPAG